MIAILDTTDCILGERHKQCHKRSLHIIKTTDAEVNKMDFYNKLGVNSYNDNYPDIVYYSPNHSVRACGGGYNIIGCRSDLQIFYETAHFDIVIGECDVRYAKNRIHFKYDNVFINDKHITPINTIDETVKHALSLCISDIIDTYQCDNLPENPPINCSQSEIMGLYNENRSLKCEIKRLERLLGESKAELDELKEKLKRLVD